MLVQVVFDKKNDRNGERIMRAGILVRFVLKPPIFNVVVMI